MCAMRREVILVYRDGSSRRFPQDAPNPILIRWNDSTGRYRFRLTDRVDEETGLYVYEEATSVDEE